MPAMQSHQFDSLLGNFDGDYADGLASDPTYFVVLCLFDVGKSDPSQNQCNKLFERIAPLLAAGCTGTVIGFASNTTNANWSHQQNIKLAHDRLQNTASVIMGSDGDPKGFYLDYPGSGETGPDGVEDQMERCVAMCINLGDVPAPTPLTGPSSNPLLESRY